MANQIGKWPLIGLGVVVVGVGGWFLIQSLKEKQTTEVGRSEYSLRENIEMYSVPRQGLSPAQRAQFDKASASFLEADAQWWELYAKAPPDQKKKWREERLAKQEPASQNPDDLARIKEFDQITRSMLETMKQ